MQEYFEQYVEEYYENPEECATVIPKREIVVQEEKILETVDDIYNFLLQERASNIVVLELGDNGPTFFRTIIVCSPFNSRHGFAMADSLRKAARLSDEAVIKRSVRNGFGWFQVALGTIQVHVMNTDLRIRFDIEGLWGAGDAEEVPDDDDIDLIPPPQVK